MASLVLQERVQELIDVQSVDVPVRRDVSCPQIVEQLVSLWAPFQNSKWACCGPLVSVAMGPSGGLVAQLRMMVSRKWALFLGQGLLLVVTGVMQFTAVSCPLRGPAYVGCSGQPIYVRIAFAV